MTELATNFRDYRIVEALINGQIKYRVYHNGYILRTFDDHSEATSFKENMESAGLPKDKTPLEYARAEFEMIAHNGAKPKADIPYWVVVAVFTNLLNYEREVLAQYYDKGWADGFHQRNVPREEILTPTDESQTFGINKNDDSEEDGEYGFV